MPLKVAVIGGGWLGLYALKWLAAEPDVDVRMFEKDVDIGGNWLHRPNRAGGVWEGTHATASKTYLHASDFPMPQDTPFFPHHTTIMKYLHQYCTHFQLWDRIMLNTAVHRVKRVQNGWEVSHFKVDLAKSCEPYWKHCEPGERDIVVTEFFDRVVIATGQNIPTPPSAMAPFSNFQGAHINADEYKRASDFAGKRVLVVGGGESASDIAYELSMTAAQTYMSMRSGVWMHDRLMGHAAADVLVNRAVYVPGYYSSGLITAARVILEVVWGAGGSGVDEWQPKGPYFRSFLNKSRDVIQAVARGSVLPRDEVIGCEGRTFWTATHGPAEVDVIIYATGMRENVEVLDESFQCKLSELYDFVWHPQDTTLAFCGTARPIFGSFMSMAELQARYIAEVWVGRVRLPPKDEMVRAVERELEWHRMTFVNDDKRLSTLVCHWDYCDRIARRIGARPNLVREFIKSPRRWWWLVAGPWSPFQYLINDPAQREVSFKRIIDDWPVKNNGFQICYLFALSHGLLLLLLGICFVTVSCALLVHALA